MTTQTRKLERLGVQSRDLSATIVRTDENGSRVTLSFSSEAPVDRWFGSEILSHEPNAARLGRLNDAAPLLFNHRMDDLLGVVERAWIGSDRRGYAQIRFGQDERGQWAAAQMRDGILRNVSFGYRIHKFLTDEETATYTATDWEPLEISMVTVPADQSVGVGRSDTGDDCPVAIEYAARSGKPNSAPADHTETLAGGTMTTTTENPAGTNQRSAEQIIADERGRIDEIEAMCAAHNVPSDMRAKMIKDGVEIAAARGLVLDWKLTKTSDRQAGMGFTPAPDLSEQEQKNYSILRAMRAMLVDQNWKTAGFEKEVSDEIAKRSGKTTDGFFVPTNIPMYAHQRAPLSGGATNTGGAMVATNLLPGQFIELLRNKARVLQLGATVLSGLVGNIDIPRMTGASTAYWINDSTDTTESEPTFDKVSLAMKTIAAYGVIYRSMLLQSTPAAEMLLRADMLSVLALGIDAAALYGTGASNQPTGIANTVGVGSVIGGTNGLAVTIDHLIDLETALTASNVDEASMAYLSNAKVVGSLKKLKSTTGQYLWTNIPGGQRSGTPGEINGYPVSRTNQARSNLTKGTSSGVCSEIYFGAWDQLLVGEWGVLEIRPNPYADSVFKRGAIAYTAMQSLDIGVRHPQAFSVMSDALTA